MKSALALAIITCLVTLPVGGCATARGPRQIEARLAGGTRPETEWSRVHELAPATAVQVVVKGAQPGSRYFVWADDSDLIVLNLTDPLLPAASTRVLRDMASRHPEYFSAVRTGGTFVQDNVRVGRDGVFAADRKVADLGQVVETIARSDVSEITGPVVARGSVLGALFGGYLGFAVGVVPALGGTPVGLAWPLLISSVAVGGYLGFHWSSHETQGIIYRAP